MKPVRTVVATTLALVALVALVAVVGGTQAQAQGPDRAAAAGALKITGGTTTITFAEGWLQTLSDAGYRVTGVGGASFGTRKQGTREIVTLKIPVVRAASNTFVLKGFPGQSLQVQHRGGLRLTATSGKTTTFSAMQLIASRPASQNRIVAKVPEGTVRDAQTFLQLTSMSQLTRPRGGQVKVSFGTARFKLPGGTGLVSDVEGGTFPATTDGMVVGTVSSTLKVR